MKFISYDPTNGHWTFGSTGNGLKDLSVFLFLPINPVVVYYFHVVINYTQCFRV